jgi:hypothetical protein
MTPNCGRSFEIALGSLRAAASDRHRTPSAERSALGANGATVQGELPASFAFTVRDADVWAFTDQHGLRTADPVLLPVEITAGFGRDTPDL